MVAHPLAPWQLFIILLQLFMTEPEVDDLALLTMHQALLDHKLRETLESFEGKFCFGVYFSKPLMLINCLNSGDPLKLQKMP